MRGNSLFVFLVSCGILKTVCCGNEPSNHFGLQLSKKTDLDHPDEKEKYFFDDNAVASEDKSLEKRRLFFPETDIDDEMHSDRYSTNGEFTSKRRSDQGQVNEEHKPQGGERNFGNNQWENDRYRFHIPDEKQNVGSPMEFHPRPPPATGSNRMYEWGLNDGPERTQSRWNEGNFKQFPNSNMDHPFGGHNNGRPVHGNINNYPAVKSTNVFDKRISITTLNDAETNSNSYNSKMNSNRYNHDFRDEEMRSGYHHSDRDFYNRKNSGFWDPKLFKPEKGVIINFNTDCPISRPLNNQLVHRVVISPKAPLNAESEISAYQFPGHPFISGHQLNPYYL